MLAALLAYGALVLGLLLTNAASDPACGLPGPEVLVTWLTLLSHAWVGLFVTFRIARPDRAVDAFLLGIPVAVVAFAVSLADIGPAVYPALRCDLHGTQALGGLVMTGVAAALLARKDG